MRTSTSLGLVLLCASGCGVGSVMGGDDSTLGDDSDLPANALCNSEVTISGTFTSETTPQPGPELGCVPMGTWTVQVTVADIGDCEAAPISDTYVYVVTGEGAGQVIEYDGQTGEELNAGIHAGGNGQCEGSFEHIWPASDGEFHVAQFGPYFEAGTQTMLGTGSYQLWSEHP